MNLKLSDIINNDIKVAMKEKNKLKLQTLRYMKSMFMENSTSKKPIEELDVLIKQHKKLKDSLESFPSDHPMFAQTNEEISILSDYLPKALTEEEVVDIISQIKKSLENPNMGAIMKELQPQIKGRFDGKKASQLVINSLKS